MEATVDETGHDLPKVIQGTLISSEKAKGKQVRLRSLYDRQTDAPDKSISVINSYVVNSSIIHIEEGFNLRDLNFPHILKLAKAYIEGAQIDAIWVECIQTEDGEIICIVRDGHHRFIAQLLAGYESMEVNEFTGSERERHLFMFKSKQDLPLTTLNKAKGILRLRKEFNLSDSAIGRELGVSPTTIANYLKVLDLPWQLQELVDCEKISMTFALELFAEHQDGTILYLISKGVIIDTAAKSINERVDINRAFDLKQLESHGFDATNEQVATVISTLSEAGISEIQINPAGDVNTDTSLTNLQKITKKHLRSASSKGTLPSPSYSKAQSLQIHNLLKALKASEQKELDDGSLSITLDPITAASLSDLVSEL